jgi:2-hydroxychromene-2-carboxylate isomerase
MPKREHVASGPARTDPPWLLRRLGSLLMGTLASEGFQSASRAAAEVRRRVTGSRHRVDYFHRVDDPYGHLAVQLVPRLAAAYDIEIVCHLCGPAERANEPEPALLADYARRDSADIAPHYGLVFPADAPAPSADDVALAERCLAAAEPGEFATRAYEVGQALWAGGASLGPVAERFGPTSPEAALAARRAGTELRAKLGHYSGAMFHYGGEWYWGVDRAHHLERRLAGLGIVRPGAAVPIAPRPSAQPGAQRATGGITLQFFPSLRSPYTAVVYDRVLELAERTGVTLELLPVLPMVMRGVPATFAKGRYIFTDAAREARIDGVPYGKVVDPIGEPVERAFALFPLARERGLGAEWLGSFLRAAFAEGIDTSRDAGLRTVVERVGLSWDEALEQLASGDGWRDELEANRQTLYEELGLWGVPSFRVRGPEGWPDLATWGQDRLWLVAAELRARIADR